jgi:hypothetical protein
MWMKRFNADLQSVYDVDDGEDNATYVATYAFAPSQSELYKEIAA